jgi:hypothetical protein
MYILGTVLICLLHIIMIRRMTLLVVPNIKGKAYIGTWYCFKIYTSSSFMSVLPCSSVCLCPCLCTCTQYPYNCNLYFCSPHNTVYYPLSTPLSLTPPTPFPSLQSLCHISAHPNTLSLCSDPHTIATLPTADSHTVASYHTESVDSFGNAVSIFISTVRSLLYLRSSHSSALTFVNVSTDSELTLLHDIKL